MPFGFDRVFDQYATQYEVFQHTTQVLVNEVLNGYNCACFAYGATGAGKTYTMVGTQNSPGVMVLTLQELFSAMKATQDDKKYSVHISYLEVYNENIHDLLVPQSKPLQLLESGDNMTVLGLTQHEPNSAEEVLQLLQEGNTRRAQNFTHANAESSRSHAVLQITVEQRDRSAGTTAAVRTAKFSLIDLAGSERASKTKNQGKQLVEGANINRSLLALGNCINALGNGYTDGKYVPYRDSKLTRLLKDSLGGNCKTIMISNVSPSTLSYEDTFNTLQYANRAKNIKTKVRANEINVVMHVSEYKAIIADLQKQVEEWKHKAHRYEDQLEEASRERQAEIDQEFEEQVTAQMASREEIPIEKDRAAFVRSTASTTVPGSAVKMPRAPSQASLPLLSRTVSMGLQTPRNSKTEKRMQNLASQVDDVISDRRNVQKNLEVVNTMIADLQTQKTALQEQLDNARQISEAKLPLAVADLSSPLRNLPLNAELNQSPSKSHLRNNMDGEESVQVFLGTATPLKRVSSPAPHILLRRDIEGLSRKLDEYNTERETLLQRMGRNAEKSKSLQTDMASITPHADDVALFRQLKLELVINVLEISNFNRMLHESQLVQALCASNEKTAAALEIVQTLRNTLGENGFEEPSDVVQRCELLQMPVEQPASSLVQMPSPFTARSPRVQYAASLVEADSYGGPSTPSRFFSDTSSSAPAPVPAVSSSMKTRPARTEATSVAPRPASAATASSASRSVAPSTQSKNVAQNASRVNNHVKANSTTLASAKKPVAPRTAVRPAPSASKPANGIVSRVTTSASTANTTTTSSVAAKPAPTTTAAAAKKGVLGAPVRIGSKPISSVQSQANTTNKPFQGQSSDPKLVTPTKVSHKYKNDPVVAKAMASFKPTFEPQERSSPSLSTPSSAKVNIPKGYSAANVSTMARSASASSAVSSSAPITSSASSDNISPSASIAAISSYKYQPNALAALLPGASGGFIPPSYSPLDAYISPSYTRAPTAGTVYSPTSPSSGVSNSPLVTISASSSRSSIHSPNASPVSPLSKPMRV